MIGSGPGGIALFTAINHWPLTRQPKSVSPVRAHEQGNAVESQELPRVKKTLGFTDWRAVLGATDSKKE